MLLYALLYLTGSEGVTLDELKRFRQLGAATAGHPEFGHCPGVETTTGPLGQALLSWLSTRCCSAAFTVSRTGVVPSAVRYTPTPRSIFSGRVSFLYSAIRPRIASGGSALSPSNTV
jgi:hypothetical protein